MSFSSSSGWARLYSSSALLAAAVTWTCVSSASTRFENGLSSYLVAMTSLYRRIPQRTLLGIRPPCIMGRLLNTEVYVSGLGGGDRRAMVFTQPLTCEKWS